MVNKRKVEAVDNEDFELAAKYKHQANDLRNKLLTAQNVSDLMRNRPALTSRELLDLMLEVDTNLHFMANLLDSEASLFLDKEYLLSKLMYVEARLTFSLFLAQQSRGLSKLKSDASDVVQCIS